MDPSKLAERKPRARRLLAALKRLFPEARIELAFSNPWELLVATILSAQCTDKKVNQITARLFVDYPTLADYLRAGQTAAGIAAFEAAVRQSGFFRAKTRHILGAARTIEQRFGGKVPATMDELLEIPGVARKTATVVLALGFGVTAGITVDTHVIRFAQRFDLSDSKDPVRIERDLMELLPKKDWTGFALRATLYGRYLAPARAYDTSKDPLLAIYPPAAQRFRT